MSVQEIFDLLPLEVKEDLYFQQLSPIIERDIKDLSKQLILKIRVNNDIYNKIDDKSLVEKNDNSSIMNFMYRLGDSIGSLAIREEEDSIYIYFEVKSLSKLNRTVLIKRPECILVETKNTLKENGFYKSFDSGLYCYDENYQKINIDQDSCLDAMFAEEFGVQLSNARKFRNNFGRYAKILSVFRSEQQMRISDAKLNDRDFFNFRSPWLVSEVKNFIENEINDNNEDLMRKVFNKNFQSTFNREMKCIENIILWIQENLGDDSEFVISNNIFQNLIPLISGEDAMGYDTKGYILEKSNNDYILYVVHFKTSQTIFTKTLISKEEAQKLFLSNPNNQNVQGLHAFFGVSRGR